MFCRQVFRNISGGFRVFGGISQDFAEKPEFRGSATARNIRSPAKRSSLLTTVSARNVAHLSDSQYGKIMNFYAEIRTCSCHAISPTLESHAIYSVCFIFLILYSKKIFGLTGNSQCYSCLYMEAEI